jgi:hypothetical protein
MRPKTKSSLPGRTDHPYRGWSRPLPVKIGHFRIETGLGDTTGTRERMSRFLTYDRPEAPGTSFSIGRLFVAAHKEINSLERAKKVAPLVIDAPRSP